MRKAISILGPTHCGKSELAIEVNKLFPSKIISVDSVQVYKSANIGSSKPEKEILNKKFEFNKKYEDIHMNIEKRLFQIIGDEAGYLHICLLYTSPSPRDLSTSRMPSSA